MNMITKQLVWSSLFATVLVSLVLVIRDMFSLWWISPLAIISGALIGTIIANITIYSYNKRLSEDCNCEVEDIYYAIGNFGWSTEWIRENATKFSYYLDKEKLKKGN